MIPKDDQFIESSIPVLSSFYERFIMPELLTRSLENASVQKTSKKLYCVCQKEYSDKHNERWIGCDAVDCKEEWFHFKCVNVQRPPKGKWYCPSCKRKKKQQKRRLSNDKETNLATNQLTKYA